MTAPTLRLGPFDLIRAFGRGAMGEVWHARHRAQGVDVAIKLLHGSTARDPWAVEAFRNEVRAVAGLSHPGIVTVVDHGLVPRDSDLATQGHNAPGTPYLVMEFVHGRPMNRFVGRMSWNQVRSILLQLLDALAHSHARGVVHRDLKPGNVLLCLPGGKLPSAKHLQPNQPLEVKLTDFGLAQAVDRHSAADAVVAGTPAYMAPEQLQGSWRDQGPGTDLYSIGCLGWAMATGTPPFGKDQPFEEALHCHLHLAPPPFKPVIPVPPGFEAWLRRLLAKSISDRFPRAADAAWGLTELSGQSTRIGGDEEPDEGPTTLASVPFGHPAMELIDDEPTERQPRGVERKVIVQHTRQTGNIDQRRGTPVPETWRHPIRSATIDNLYGVGLNLFGLRKPPMVGRTDERDLLWGALRDVYETGVGQAIILEGPAGVGRSRLGGWLCERADEVGAARVLTALHDEDTIATSGLAPMVMRYLRCTGLEYAGVRERLAGMFPEGDTLHDDIDALATFLAPQTAPEDTPWARRLTYPRERFSLVRRLLERESAGHSSDEWEAVAVVWLDDAHLGSDTLDFCRFLIEIQTADPLPVLLLISVQPQALSDPDRFREAEVLEGIRSHPRTRTLPLGPLPEDHHARLVRSLLGMDGELVEQLAARTAGNPQFAVQLVGEWVKGGLLQPGAHGFTLREGATVDLPADMERVWTERRERLLVGLTAEDAQALEVSAVLGMEFDKAEWTDACKAAGIDAHPRIIERLTAQRLITPRNGADPKGWVFVHSMLRESLIRRARLGGRLLKHHKACATMLEERIGTRPGIPERLGRHLLMAGHVVPALGRLLEGAEERRRSGEAAAALRLLEYRERALRSLDLPTEDELWGLGWVERVEIDLEDGDPNECELLLGRAEAAAVRNNWARVTQRATLVRGRLHRLAGRMHEALRALDEARISARRAQDPDLEAQAWLETGITHLRLGHANEARKCVQSARGLFSMLHNDHGIARSELTLGRVALLAREPDDAERFFRQAHDEFQSSGARGNAAECRNGLGDVERMRGKNDKAEALFRASLADMEAIAHNTSALPRLNIAILMVERGAYIEARRLIEPALLSTAVRTRPVLAVAAHLVLLAPVAAAGDWAAWDHHVGRAGSMLATTGLVDRDFALLAQLGAEQAVRKGEPDRARSAWGLAYQQHEALGEKDRLAAIEARVRALT